MSGFTDFQQISINELVTHRNLMKAVIAVNDRLSAAALIKVLKVIKDAEPIRAAAFNRQYTVHIFFINLVSIYQTPSIDCSASSVFLCCYSNT